MNKGQGIRLFGSKQSGRRMSIKLESNQHGDQLPEKMS